jgi:hypothetical protein
MTAGRTGRPFGSGCWWSGIWKRSVGIWRTRFYALEQTIGLDDVWTTVPGCGDLPGNNELFLRGVPIDSGPIFFRARVWLVP